MSKTKLLTYIESPVYYMGCKYKLLKYIIPLFPKQCRIFYDLFGGSGVVCMNYKGIKNTIYNDYNTQTADLVKMIQQYIPEDLDKYLTEQITKYNIVTFDKNFRENIELQKGYYDFRTYYNTSIIKDIRDLYLLSCYSINHLIRFNFKGEFNAPCGKGQRYIKEKVIKGHEALQGIEIQNKDAFMFNYSLINSEDFVYMDIPYCNTDAVYTEKLSFGNWNIDNDYKIFDILEQLNERKIKWALSNVFVNRGNINQHLIDWCDKNHWNVVHINHNYHPFSTNGSQSDEVLICNYLT